MTNNNTTYEVNENRYNCLLISVLELLKVKSNQKNKKLLYLLNEITCLPAIENERTESTKQKEHQIYLQLKQLGLYQ